MKFTYSQSAQQRLAQQGETSINAFVDEVPSAVRRKILEALPAIAGFRKGPPLLKKQSERLVHTVGHASDATSRTTRNYWSAFGALWASWGEEKFPRAFPSGPFDFANASEEDAVAFVRKLVDGAPSGCAREDVERLVLFSGLPTSEAISAFISRLPSKTTLERERALSKLPEDVADIRSQLRNIQQSIGKLDSGMRAASADSAEAGRVATRAAADSGETQRTLVEIEKRAVASQRDISTLTDKVAAQAKQLDGLLKSSADSKRTSEEDQRVRFQALQKSIGELTSELASVKENLARVTDENRALVDALKSKNDSATAPPEQVSVPSFAVGRPAFAGVVRWEDANSDAEPIRLDDVDAFFKLTLNNLAASGIRQTDADCTARAIVGAALAGQLLQYRGSLSGILGTAVAVTSGGGKALSWDVPLGLRDGCEMDAVLRMAKEGEAQVIVLKGANKSAFEIYGGALRDLIVRRQLAPATIDRHLLVATWAEGPAAIPGGGALIELGPVVDTDKLAWSSTADQSRLMLGRIVQDELERESSEIHGVFGDELAEINRLVESLELPPNRLWRMAFSRFSKALFTLPDATFASTVSVALNTWVIPWGKAMGIGKERFEKAIKACAAEQLKVTSVEAALSELPDEVVV